jgi:hypothetical protein
MYPPNFIIKIIPHFTNFRYNIACYFVYIFHFIVATMTASVV